MLSIARVGENYPLFWPQNRKGESLESLYLGNRVYDTNRRLTVNPWDVVSFGVFYAQPFGTIAN